jgi:hypothetical protein
MDGAEHRRARGRCHDHGPTCQREGGEDIVRGANRPTGEENQSPAGSTVVPRQWPSFWWSRRWVSMGKGRGHGGGVDFTGGGLEEANHGGVAELSRR